MGASLSIPKNRYTVELFRPRWVGAFGYVIPKAWVKEVGWLHSAALLLWCYMQED